MKVRVTAILRDGISVSTETDNGYEAQEAKYVEYARRYDVVACTLHTCGRASDWQLRAIHVKSEYISMIEEQH